MSELTHSETLIVLEYSRLEYRTGGEKKLSLQLFAAAYENID